MFQLVDRSLSEHSKAPGSIRLPKQINGFRHNFISVGEILYLSARAYELGLVPHFTIPGQ